MTFTSYAQPGRAKPAPWFGRARRAFLPITWASLAVSVTTGAAAADPLPAVPASVIVDFAQSQGPLVRTEKFNNLHTTSVFAAQRSADIAYLNSKGLHGSIFRVWLNSPNEATVAPCAEDIASPPAADKPCTLNAPFAAYLKDAEQAADKVLGNLRLDGTPGFITAGGPEAAVPLIERLLLAIKRANPKFTYVEAWNEPDAPGTTWQPSQVYPYYVAVYRAVNSINATLSATNPDYVPMQVGGPALYFFNKPWIAAFLDGYAADPDPAKRLDFLSYHAYVGRDAAGTTLFYKAQPTHVVGQRAELEAMMQARGISTRIPSYVTETGAYPGPLCDQCDTTDYARSAAGVASIHYWLANEPLTVPFNWLMRQRSGANGGSGLKDQLVTANPQGTYRTWRAFNPLPPSTFTPFGNMLVMKSMMKTERVAAHSNSLPYNGIGVYALAAKDPTGVSMMVWNYQGCPGFGTGNPPTNPSCPNVAYKTAVTASNLPASVHNRRVLERVYLIDQNTSNYFADPTRASLQLVSSRVISRAAPTDSSYSTTLDLAPNAIYLVVIEPTKPQSRDGRLQPKK